MKSLNNMNNLVIELNTINNLPINGNRQITNYKKLTDLKTNLQEAYYQLKLKKLK